MTFIKHTKIKWYNRNIFYCITLLVVFANIFAFYFGGNNWAPEYVQAQWIDVLNFQNIIVCFLSAFEHSNLQHCLLNCLCFLIAGSYVEQKIGSLNFFVLIFALAFFCECAIDANCRSGSSHGFSGVNYGIYAYIIIDYIFSFINKQQTKTNIIYGAIMIALIYLACCFCGGTTSFEFALYPYDLITNMGHYTAFVSGGILTILLQLVKFQTIQAR